MHICMFSINYQPISAKVNKAIYRYKQITRFEIYVAFFPILISNPANAARFDKKWLKFVYIVKQKKNTSGEK